MTALSGCSVTVKPGVGAGVGVVGVVVWVAGVFCAGAVLADGELALLGLGWLGVMFTESDAVGSALLAS